MNCPNCGHTDTSVMRTRDGDATVERLRNCGRCAKRWLTREVPEPAYLKIAGVLDAYQALGDAIEGRSPQRRCIATSVYRHYDKVGALLYVGIARRVTVRTRTHARTSPWFMNVARTEVVEYPSREAALHAEITAIRSEHPAHNIAGKPRQ